MKNYEATALGEIVVVVGSHFLLGETHHVFDFSSSVFHSIFIVAVLFLFVLFVVGVHQEEFIQNSAENSRKKAFSFLTLSFRLFLFNVIYLTREVKVCVA